jgi:cellulose synthase/poly-beta-1,6-N-acetylglucosamine synthase-like glycosyltransferase
MIHMSQLVFYLCATLLLYSWLGYPTVLKLLSRRAARLAQLRRRRTKTGSINQLPIIRVLVTVWNGEGVIVERLRNILAQDYPPDRIGVFVASDGSTDRTIEAARSVKDARIIVKQFPHGGKSRTQNAAIIDILDEIVVFTDVDTRFAPGFVRELVLPFADPQVGCVSGRLVFLQTRKGISSSQSLYWRYETWLRGRESDLGLLATASGACMACRRALLHPLMPSCGEDCTVPLDIAMHGYMVIHTDGAVAYDIMPSTPFGELRARARMTSRNMRGTIAYAELLNPLLNPGYAFSLWSHKLLRWMTPLFIGGLFFSSVALYPEYRVFMWGEFLFLASAGFGAALYVVHPQPPRFFSAPFSFLLANLGFLLGLVQFLRGEELDSYSNIAPPADLTDNEPTVRPSKPFARGGGSADEG